MVREERDLGFRGRGKATEDDILVVIIIIIIIYLIHLGEGERMEMKAGKRINDTFVLLLQSEQQTNKQTNRWFGSAKNHQLRAGSSSSSSSFLK